MIHATTVRVLRHGSDDDDSFLTPERKAESAKPVARGTQQGKRVRAGPLLPFLSDFSSEDARKSFDLHDAEFSSTKKAKRKHSASF